MQVTADSTEPKPGHHDDERLGGARLDLLEEFRAVAIGQADVAEDQVEVVLVEVLPARRRWCRNARATS
jgi:hypothetical protein